MGAWYLRVAVPTSATEYKWDNSVYLYSDDFEDIDATKPIKW